MPSDLPLMVQTIYAELFDRISAAAFAEAFPAEGVFIAKTVRRRRYWYFQADSANGRNQKYAGPETPELLDRITHHKAAQAYLKDQRSLVAMLVRSGNLPRPLPAILGCRLPAALTHTQDVDVAQFAEVSTAVADMTRPMQDVLRQVDPSFRVATLTLSRRGFACSKRNRSLFPASDQGDVHADRRLLQPQRRLQAGNEAVG